MSVRGRQVVSTGSEPQRLCSSTAESHQALPGQEETEPSAPRTGGDRTKRSPERRRPNQALPGQEETEPSAPRTGGDRTKRSPDRRRHLNKDYHIITTDIESLTIQDGFGHEICFLYYFHSSL